MSYLFTDEAGEVQRRDLCSECAETAKPPEDATNQPVPFSAWPFKVQPPPVVPEVPLKKETAESLLRRLITIDSAEYTEALYILAVMLERSKIFIERAVHHTPEALVRIYEHKRTNEIFTIVDPRIQLEQIPAIQVQVLALLNGDTSTLTTHSQTDETQQRKLMKLDPTQMKDWQVAEAAEATMRPIQAVAKDLGVLPDEFIPYGSGYGKIDAQAVLKRCKGQQKAYYIDVTAITPTPLGEGKTTTTIGLTEGLGRLGKNVVATIRQPSGGPTFNIKGSAAGGGLSQVIPLSPFSLGLTGDFDSITNANNLCMVALSARMQHERNYDDARLATIPLKRLDIDPERVQMKWALDFCAQALRQIRIGMGPGKMNGYEMDSGFYITVASEVMAILAVASDLADLRKRIGKIIVAYSKSGLPVTADDLEVAGAMTAWLVRALNPTLMQTIEGQPVLVHAGPFANIALGQNSVIADRVAACLSDYVITESGFAADMGFEKFWNIKCRCSKLRPNAVVLVATVRALKRHGGAPDVKPGKPLDPVYSHEALDVLEAGCRSNLLAHIDIIRKSGITPVVCLNHFYTDTDAEVTLVEKIVKEAGARFALSKHWEKGGEGAEALANEVIAACEDQSDFHYLSDLSTPLSARIEALVKEVYGGDGVDYEPEALAKLQAFEANPETASLPVCMAKTQYSLSDDATKFGRPTGWRLHVQDILIYQGAGFIVPVSGEIRLMPGTGSNPAYRRIDVDVETGKVKGLF